MFLVVLFILLLFFLTSWFLITTSTLKFRPCDIPLLTLLTVGVFFYGVPVVTGFLTGWISTGSILLSFGILLTISIYTGFKSTNLSFSWRHLVNGWCQISNVERVIWGFVTVGLLLLLVVGSQLSFSIWDGLGYHAQNPIRWALDHQFKLDCFGEARLDPYNGVPETYPNIKAVLAFLVMDLTGTTKGVGITQWPFLLFLLSGLHVIIRRCQLPRWGTLVAFLFCFCAPEVLIQSVNTYADVAMFSAVMCVVATCLILWQDGPNWYRMLFCAISFGLMVGMKPTGIVQSVPLGTAFLIMVYIRSSKSTKFHRLREALFGFLMVVIIANCFAGPWYIHTLTKFKNPVYPVQVSVGEKVIFDGPAPMAQTKGFTKKYTGKEGFAAWWHILKETHRIPMMGGWHSGVGAPVFIFGLISLVIFLFFALLSPDWKLYLPVSCLFFASWLGMPAVDVPRFAICLLGPFSFCFVWCLVSTYKWIRIPILIIFGLVISYDLSRTIPALLCQQKPAEVYAYAIMSGHSSWVPHQNFPSDYGPMNYWCDTADSGDKIGVMAKETVTHFLPRDWNAGMVLIPHQRDFNSFEEWVNHLKSLEITHLYLPDSAPEWKVVELHPKYFTEHFIDIYSPSLHNWYFKRPQKGKLYTLIGEKGAKK